MSHEETAPAEISITVNGEARKVRSGRTLRALLDDLALPPERVAVECNRKILRRETFSEVILEPGDRLEIVQFVGGG
jgi:thiamine biosynthesis protein ThiS